MSAPLTRSVELSVLVMTYNHAGFIAQALDSALAQRTDFSFEILISEDCSTDGTREAVIEYAERHPGKIRLLLSTVNLRSNAVVSRGIAAARGAYLAFLDGDDIVPLGIRGSAEAFHLRGHLDGQLHTDVLYDVSPRGDFRRSAVV